MHADRPNHVESDFLSCVHPFPTVASMHPLKRMSIGVLCAFAASTTLASAAALSDIANSADKTAIEYLKEKNIITGYADGTFQPDATINRAELLKILIGSLDIHPSADAYHDCFPDVKKEWFAPYVCYAKEKNLISGYADGTFRPDNPVNTVEAIKMIINVYGYELMQTSSVAPYSDVDPSAWYAPYVNLARSAGILEAGKKLGVSAAITRGKVSYMIYRSMKNRESTSTPLTATVLQKMLPSLRRGGGGNGQSHTADSQSTSSQTILSSPTITFGAINKNYGDTAFALTPSSNSAGAFTFTSSDTNVATVSGDTVTIVAAGTTTLTVTQAANGNYTAGSTTAVLTVSAIAPTIGTFSNVGKYLGDVPFALTAPSSNSAGGFTYVSSDTDVATIAGSTVTLVSSGTATITATQAANGNYTSGTKTMTLTVYFGGCISEPCMNGGTCTNAPGGNYSCECEDGFSGYSCEMDGSNCADDGPYNCLNGGTCTPNAAHGECTCTECFMGSRCELFNSGACA